MSNDINKILLDFAKALRAIDQDRLMRRITVTQELEHRAAEHIETKALLEQKIAQETNKARIDELKNLWSHAREHTITDIEMIMHHTGGKVDFIEAVSTDIFEKRIQALTADKEQADE